MRVDNTRNERAARVRAKKLAEGMASRQVYLSLDTLESLRLAFPGPLGGIDWQRVAGAALSASTGSSIPPTALDQLRAEFPDQGATFGIDWPKVTESALTREKHRRRDAERQRRCMERKRRGETLE